MSVNPVVHLKSPRLDGSAAGGARSAGREFGEHRQ
jgi:hypothetical protein